MLIIIICVSEPIAVINITGGNWIQHGDLMNLQVKYPGTYNYDNILLPPQKIKRTTDRQRIRQYLYFDSLLFFY